MFIIPVVHWGRLCVGFWIVTRCYGVVNDSKFFGPAWLHFFMCGWLKPIVYVFGCGGF